MGDLGASIRGKAAATMRVGSAACLSALVGLAGVAGCGDSGSVADTQHAVRYYGTTRPQHGPDEIWTNLGSEPEYIDPGKVSDSAGGIVITNLFSGLVEAHPKTLEPMPGIAERWDVDPDGTRYVFHLRKSQWSDGKALTAHDFEYSWKRLLDPKTASKYGGFLAPIELAEAFNLSAVLVAHVPNDVSDAELLRLLGSDADKVLRVQRVPRTQAAALFVKGEGAEADRARASVIAALSKAQLRGAPVRARVTDANAVGLRAIDEQTFEVRLENPLPYFLSLIAYHITSPVPRHVIERLERAGTNPDLWTRPEHIVNNGAYLIEEWAFRQHIWFKRNPKYWDAANVKTSRVRFVMIDSYNTTLNLYKAGELDYIGENSSLPSEFMDHLARFGDFHRDPFLSVYLYWVNTKAKPLDDPRVRRALSLAIDRESLVKYVTRAGQIPTSDLVPDGLAGYRSPKSKVFDPEAARALMKQAGYADGLTLPPTTLSYNTSEGHKQIAEAVQQMWKQHLGVSIAIENQEWKVYLKNLQQMTFQMARLGWVGDYADPFTFLELLKSTNGNNHSGWANERYDDLLRQANATLDTGKRLALLREAETLAMAEAPMIPIYVYTRSEMWKPYLKGMWSSYIGNHAIKYWWIDKRWYDGVPTTPVADEPPPLPSRHAP